jgi:MraZ protein
LAFRGTYDHSLDSKHRLTVPAKFRSSLAGGVVLAVGFDGCIAVWTPEAYDGFVAETLGDEPRLSAKRRHLERILQARSFETELDGAGRVGIPPQHREHAGLSKDCKVIGAGDHLEIWDAETWSSYNDRVMDDDLSELFGS